MSDLIRIAAIAIALLVLVLGALVVAGCAGGVLSRVCADRLNRRRGA